MQYYPKAPFSAGLSYQAAAHFKKQENYKLAAKYFQESIDANDQILRLTEGIRL